MGFGNGRIGLTRMDADTGAEDTSGFDTDLYHAERIDDDLGEGFRMYTLEDTVHEARRGTMWVFDGDGHPTGPLETRIYPDGDDWMLKANTPVTEKKPAYRAFRGFANTAEEELEVELETTWLDYQTSYEDEEDFEVSSTAGSQQITVAVRQDGSLDLPLVSYDANPATSGWVVGSLAGGTALVAQGLGVPVDPLSTLWLGWAAGAGIGGATPKILQYRTNKKRREQYGEVETLNEADMFDRINEKQRLEAILRRPGPAPDHFTEQYNAMREDEFEEIFDAVTTAHFDSFEEQAGVTLTGRFDSYTDAYGVAAALTGNDDSAERPSIYTDHDAFTALFDHLLYEEDGEKHLLPDGERLIGNVLHRDKVNPAITRWLDEHHPDLVQDIGQKHSLEGGRDG